MASAHLMVMVSHDLESLGMTCNVGVWLDHGKVLKTGPMKDVVAAYKASVQTAKAKAAA